ncbi:MAG: 5'-methylthioadenosine/S-adenosylhomocysteine nucleosidase [Firmicutes bacterium]|nr:5'-methylthioadenosine/S-adenosylhomocysteine nucleosidase [Bacillota bacterium]
MNTIGIISAYDEMIDKINEKTSPISAKNILGFDFALSKTENSSILTVKGGFGKVNKAILSQIMIDMYAVDYIIDVGAAYPIDKSAVNGDVVIVDKAFYYDIDFSSVGYVKGSIPKMTEETFLCDEALINAAKEVLDGAAIGNLFVSSLASGESPAGDDVKAFCADSDGAAAVHTCSLNRIPCVLIKAISEDIMKLPQSAIKMAEAVAEIPMKL